MSLSRVARGFVVAVLVATATACVQGPAPAAAPTPPVSPTSVAPATVAPTLTPPAATPTSTAVPLAGAGTTGAPSLADLAARARQQTEYSFNVVVTAAGQTFSARGFVKPNRMRQEMSIAGQSTIMVMDTASKVAHMLMSGDNVALKLDFSQVSSEVENPAEQVASLPADARLVGTDTIDGKPAVIYEATQGQDQGKFWIWTERGLPLKVEVKAPEGLVTVEFSEYRFEPQPDSLFELPPGTQVMEMPGGFPGNIPPVKP